MKNSVIAGSNRYTQGGITDYFPNRVGWWERTVFDRHSTDIMFEIDAETEFRPDLISYKVYNNEVYFWIVLQFNSIVDINEELTTGTIIHLPTIDRLNAVLSNTSVGGRKVSDNV